MTNIIAAGESFNMMLLHIDRSDPVAWTGKFSKEDIQHKLHKVVLISQVG
jgi:hypothetical protein